MNRVNDEPALPDLTDDAAATGGLDVGQLRADTPGCASVTHLNNAGAALVPAAVNETVIAHLRLEDAVGGYEAAAQAAERLAAVYQSVAQLIGGDPARVALVESATDGWDRGLQAIAHSQPLRPSDRVLVSGSEYASNVVPLMQLSAGVGARVEFVPDDESGAVDVDALERMLDDDVAIVAVNHCPSQNGLINDVAAVGAALSGSRAWYLVDACQSVGQLPVDVEAIGADFLSATGRKFLRGPRGTGFVHVSRRALDELEPFPLDLHSATWTPDGYVVAPGARRFEHWERSAALALGLGAAIDYALDCGIQALHTRIAALALYARESLAAVGGVTATDRGTVRSGIVTFKVDGRPAADVVSALRAQRINVSLSTPDYSRHDFDGHGHDALVRMSPHAYNTTSEIDRLVNSLAVTA